MSSSTQPQHPSSPTPTALRPGVAIAIGIGALLAIVLTVKAFRGSSSEESPASSAADVAHPRGGLKLNSAQRARVEGGGWVAEAVDTGDTEHAAGSVPPRVGSADGASAEPAGADGAAVSGAQKDSRSANTNGAQGSSGTDAGTKASASTGNANQTGAVASGAAPAGPAAAGVQGGNSRASAGNSNAGSKSPPVDSQQAAPLGLDQGTTLFNHTDNPACQGATCAPLPADSQTAINVGEGQSVISGKSGALSFWLQPQWEATDSSTATLVQLGTGDTPANGFEIYKNGQSLVFSFAGNDGVPVEISAAIDWQPGDQHLVTPTWSQGQDGQGQISFYIDGKLAGTQPYSGAFEFAQNMPLTIGSNYGDGSTVPGTFGTFHLYKNPLTPDQVAAQAAAGPMTKGGAK